MDFNSDISSIPDIEEIYSCNKTKLTTLGKQQNQLGIGMFNMKFIFVLLSLVLQVAKLIKADEVSEAYNDCKDTTGFDVEQIASPYISALLLPGEVFLDQYCDVGLKFKDCMANKLEQYDDRAWKKMFPYLNNILTKLCTPESDMRKFYSGNAVCINESIPEIKLCVERTWAFVYSQFKNERTESDREEMMCLHNYLIHVVCIHDILEANCGTKCGGFIQALIQNAPIPTNEICTADVTARILETYEEKIKQWRAEAGYIYFI